MSDPFKVDPKLKDWATDRQIEMIDAVNLHGSASAAARALGIASASNIGDAIKRVKTIAAAHGYSPDHNLTHVIPSPFVAKGHSTYYDRDAQPRQQWVKTKLDDVAYQSAIREGVDAFIGETVKPILPAPAMPGRDTDVIPWIEIGDAHLGMLAHEAETGANFDLKIGERELCAAIEVLLGETGEHDRIVINDLGDFTHYENMRAETEASGHRLDADGRFPRMIKVYSRVLRFIIDRALERANVVDVIVNQGNHSRTNDIWAAELLRVAYGSSGRVNVLNNDSVFVGYRMGKTFVMTHHGDKCQAARLVDVMSTDFATDWGETEYRYIDSGHVHHGKRSAEHAGVILESFNTLAPLDKWAHDGGYRSRSSITIVDRSRTYGEIGRRTLPIQRVRDVIRAALAREGKAPVYEPQPRRAFVA
jgi:hypothetical protein